MSDTEPRDETKEDGAPAAAASEASSESEATTESDSAIEPQASEPKAAEAAEPDAAKPEPDDAQAAEPGAAKTDSPSEAATDAEPAPASIPASPEQPQAAPVTPVAQVRAPVELPPPPISTGTRVLGAIYLLVGLIVAGILLPQAFGDGLRDAVENKRLRLVIQLVSLLLAAYPAGLGLSALIRGRRPPENVNPLGFPLEAWWFDTLWVMTVREVRAVFARPVAYIVLFVFLAINGVLFWALLSHYAGTVSLTREFEVPVTYFLTNNFVTFFSLVLICPAITMRLLAEEQQAGTLEGLLTTPVTDIQVVVSKFLGATVFYASMLFVTLAYLAILRQFASEWDWGPVLGGYLGLFLMGTLFMSIGLFTSSITSSQVVAFVLALPLAVPPLFLMGFLEGAIEVEWVREVIRHVNIQILHADLNRGIVHWKTITFFLSSTLFFLFLAVRGVESHRWR